MSDKLILNPDSLLDKLDTKNECSKQPLTINFKNECKLWNVKDHDKQNQSIVDSSNDWICVKNTYYFKPNN